MKLSAERTAVKVYRDERFRFEANQQSEQALASVAWTGCSALARKMGGDGRRQTRRTG